MKANGHTPIRRDILATARGRQTIDALYRAFDVFRVTAAVEDLTRMSAVCSQCKTPIDDDRLLDPCPKCGSLGRNRVMHAGVGHFVAIGQEVGLIVIRQWPSLLNTAERLFAAGEPSVAVIVAATACEVVVERAMARANWNPPNRNFTYSLRWPTMRGEYDKCTNDDIGKQPFCSAYEALVDHRNSTAHTGREISVPEARADIDAARLFIDHVVQHNGL